MVLCSETDLASSSLASGNSKFQKSIVYPLNSVDLLDIETKRLYGTCGRFHNFFSSNLLHAVAFNCFSTTFFGDCFYSFLGIRSFPGHPMFHDTGR